MRWRDRRAPRPAGLRRRRDAVVAHVRSRPVDRPQPELARPARTPSSPRPCRGRSGPSPCAPAPARWPPARRAATHRRGRRRRSGAWSSTYMTRTYVRIRRRTLGPRQSSRRSHAPPGGRVHASSSSEAARVTSTSRPAWRTQRPPPRPKPTPRLAPRRSAGRPGARVDRSVAASRRDAAAPVSRVRRRDSARDEPLHHGSGEVRADPGRAVAATLPPRDP